MRERTRGTQHASESAACCQRSQVLNYRTSITDCLGIPERRFCWLLVTILLFPLVAWSDYEQAAEAYKAGDIQKAHDLWLREAEAGDAFSQYALGILYHRGQHGEADPAKATYWFQLAAKQDHLKAMHNLGIAYWEGHGIEQDLQQAQKWWRRGAELGYPPAQFNLAATYYMGKGVQRDLALALAWFRRAAANGNEEAINAVSMLKEKYPEAFPEEPQTITARRKGSRPPPLSGAPGNSAERGVFPVEDTEEVAATPGNTSSGPEQQQAEGEAGDGAPASPDVVETTLAAPVQSPVTQREKEVTATIPDTSLTGTVAITAAPRAKVYAFPSATAPLLGETTSIRNLRPLRRSGEWLQAMIPEGVSVWVYGRYVSGDQGMGRVNVKGLRARPYPSTGPESVAIAMLVYNDPVEIIEVRREWKRVRVVGRVAGWVRATDLAAAETSIELGATGR